MSGRIYSADEARDLRETLTANVSPEDIGTALALQWIKNLAASVEHHAALADAAEQECARLRARVAELEALATGPRPSVDDVRANIVAEIDARRQGPPAVVVDPVEPPRRFTVSTLALAEAHITVEAPSREGALAVAHRRDDGDWRIGDLFARPIFDGAEDVEELPSDDDAPALVVDDAAVDAIDGTASIGPQGVDANGSPAAPVKVMEFDACGYLVRVTR